MKTKKFSNGNSRHPKVTRRNRERTIEEKRRFQTRYILPARLRLEPYLLRSHESRFHHPRASHPRRFRPLPEVRHVRRRVVRRPERADAVRRSRGGHRGLRHLQEPVGVADEAVRVEVLLRRDVGDRREQGRPVLPLGHVQLLREAGDAPRFRFLFGVAEAVFVRR